MDGTYWQTHRGTNRPAKIDHSRPPHRNQMCPSGLALAHPAAPYLLQYATGGCPVNTGQPWTVEQMEAAIQRGPHSSALEQDAIEQLHAEVEEKVRNKQARLVQWEDIRSNPPTELKISPISMIPHKSRKYRTILDLSFSLRLQDGSRIPSVNENTVKTAPAGAIDQIGHSLSRVIHAFATSSPEEKVLMAKWDVKDGFWRLDCAEGEEWNFAYVLPQHEGPSTTLVVPNSLQMGWIESPPYFCAASETARDVAVDYIETPVGSQPPHKFLSHTQTSAAYQDLPATDHYTTPEPFRYLVDVYVDDFIGLAIPTSREQLDHVANGIMCGVHDIFPPHEEDSNDPISLKKLLQGDGAWDDTKEILGFVFNGSDKTMWLSEGKRDALMDTIKGWLRATRKNANFGIPFRDFRSVLYKIRHAFTSIPAGHGLMSPFYRVLSKEPKTVFLRRNNTLYEALEDCRRFLRQSVSTPTRCQNLVHGWPDIVGVTDASAEGVGGVVFGEGSPTPPTVFRFQWPDDIRRDVRSASNPDGSITNSDLEMAALVMLFLVIEGTVSDLATKRVALYSDNSPSVHWVQRLAARNSDAAMQLIRVLALRMQVHRISPLTTLHIEGSQNSMTDIPSRSFGSVKKWHCATDHAFLTLYNSLFPLPTQDSWTLFRLSSGIATKITSILRTKAIEAGEWRRLQKTGTVIGPTGRASQNLWEWTLTFRGSPTSPEYDSSRASPQGSDQVTSAEAARSQLKRFLRHSRPLARRSPWPSEKTPQKSWAPKNSSPASPKC